MALDPGEFLAGADVELVHRLGSGRVRSMGARVMVLCAGLGTRLLPLTEERPKPLVPVGDRPLLGHITARLRRAGHSVAVLNTHHLPEEFDKYSGSLGCKVQIIHEPKIRGTAGGVAGARPWLSAPLTVWNGDILVDPPLETLAARVGDGLCLALAPRPLGEGTVGIDADGSVVRLRGERFGVEQSGGDYVGVMALGARALDALPATGCLIGDVALPWLRAGRQIATAPVDGGWTDIGDLEAYLAVNLAWLAGRQAWVDAGARIDPGIELADVVVGAGATVQGCGRVDRCVVWPGATLTAPATRIVATPAYPSVPMPTSGPTSGSE